MKKFLLTLIAALALTGFAACNSANDTEKQLNGSWQATIGQQGVETSFVLTLDADTHDYDLEYSFNMEQDQTATLSTSGKWSATPTQLNLAKGDNWNLHLSDSFVAMTSALGIDVKQQKKTIIEKARERFDKELHESIQNITDSTFEVGYDKLTVTFRRVKTGQDDAQQAL